MNFVLLENRNKESNKLDNESLCFCFEELRGRNTEKKIKF